MTISDNMFEGRKVMDIRLRLAENIVNIRYGVSADQERSRVMKHVTQDLTRRVWRREQDIVSGALPGKHETSVIKNKNYIFFTGTWSSAWRDREIKQILRGESVDGWEVEHKQSTDEYPELSGDIINARVVRRRRSRH